MKMKLSIMFTVLFLIVVQGCIFSSKDHRGYEGDLIPLKDEVANIDNYKKATKRLIESYENLYPNVKYDNLERRDLQTYFTDSLNLRFKSFSIKIEEGDTLVTFRARSGIDYYMRGNDDWFTYTLFEHSIFYTNRKVDTVKSEVIDVENEITPYAVYSIEGQYYYKIRSRLEY